MSIVRINAIDVPEGRGADLEERFKQRAGEVDKQPGFEGFQLLRPTDESNTYFVVTHWESVEAFDAWVSSQAFGKGHAKPSGESGPVATGSKLLSFDVVIESKPQKD